MIATTQEQKIISYLTFRLQGEHFAMNVGNVVNILELTNITSIPKAPEYMRGIISLRGEVLPVIDTKVKLGLSPSEFTANTCILVIEAMLDSQHVRLGALVDAVQEVLEFEDEEILPPPSVGKNFQSAFLNGVVRHNDQFILMLDINKLLSQEELKQIKESNSTSKTK